MQIFIRAKIDNKDYFKTIANSLMSKASITEEERMLFPQIALHNI